MAHKQVEELKNLNEQELLVKVENWRRELFGLRLSASTSHIKDCSQFSKLRKNIARGLTLLTQKRSAAHTVTADKE